MKLIFLGSLFCISLLVNCSSIGYENDATEVVVSDRVIGFLYWYKTHSENLNSISVVKYPSENDTLGYYRINFDSTKKYISLLENGGFFSPKFLDNINKRFEVANNLYKKTKQNDGPPEGLEYDYFMKSQDFDLNSDSIISSAKIPFIKINNNQAIVVISFDKNGKLKYTLEKINNRWLLDDIELVN